MRSHGQVSCIPQLYMDHCTDYPLGTATAFSALRTYAMTDHSHFWATVVFLLSLSSFGVNSVSTTPLRQASGLSDHVSGKAALAPD